MPDNININNDLIDFINNTSTITLSLGTDTDLNINEHLTVNGDITAYHSSDKRLKKNVEKIQNSIDKLSKINGYMFDWIENNGIHNNKGRDSGVIAQEIEAIIPELVITRENGYKALKYDKLIPLLIECIKYNQKEIIQIKKEIIHFEYIDEEINRMKEQLKHNENEINIIKARMKE